MVNELPRVAAGFTLVFILMGTAWSAEDEASAAERVDDGMIEEVLVTGSRIKRQDFLSISPIATVDAEDITLGGVTNLEDLVNSLPQAVPSFDRTGNNPGNGTAELDLRGLGSQRTLIMLNGRRMQPHSVFGAVNINDIPAALIDRVEVVTGGASTVYGSDAVAGVVNFIVDTDVRGVTASAQYDAFEEGDGEVLDVNLSGGWGFADDRGHVAAFVGYLDRKPVLAGDREFTRVVLEEDTTTGEVRESGSFGIPEGIVFFPTTDLPGVGPTDFIIFNDDGTARPFIDPDDRYNFQPDNYLQIPMERQIAGLFAHYDVDADTRIFGEMTYSSTETGAQLAHSVFFGPFAMNVDHPSLTPYQRDLAANNWDADGDGIANFSVGRRLTEVGPRQIDRNSDSLRLVAGVEGRFGFDWDWDLSISHSNIDSETQLSNGVLAARLQQGLLVDPSTGECLDPSGGCVPISLFGAGSISPEGEVFLRAQDIVDVEEVEEQILTFNATGELLDLPAGGLSAAVGLEYRDLSGSLRSDEDLIGGGVLGFSSQSSVNGSFDVSEIYFEALAPLASDTTWARELSLEAGVRYSDYSLAGGAVNWKAGLDWAPTDSLRVRLMQQRATRAPNLDELFREPIETFQNSLGDRADECSASRDPVGNGLAELCIAQGLAPEQIGVFEARLIPTTLFLNGGSPDLDPEEGDTLTAGVVIQPSALPELSVALDYYRIEIDNAIGTIDPDTAIGLCFDANDIENRFCQPIVRGPGGDLIEMTIPQLNLAVSKASGIDLTVDYRWDLPDRFGINGDAASLDLRLFGTHVIESGNQDTPAAPFIDCAGYFSGLCNPQGVASFIVPENRINARWGYQSGPLSMALEWEWIDELKNHFPIQNELRGSNLMTDLKTADSRNYFRLSGRYDVTAELEVYGGISNLFDESPPLLGLGATQSNTAPQLYDVFGRRFFLGLRYLWE